VPPVAPTYRTASTADVRLDDIKLGRVPPPTNKWAIRAFWFMFAIVSAMGATAWQHYGDRAKQLVAEFAPQVAQLASLIPGKRRPHRPGERGHGANGCCRSAGSRDGSTAARRRRDRTRHSTAPAAASPGPATTAAAIAPDQTQLLQSMARDLASMGAQIEQLKASIDQLKAGQDQMTQRVARTTETRAIEPRRWRRVRASRRRRRQCRMQPSPRRRSAGRPRPTSRRHHRRCQPRHCRHARPRRRRQHRCRCNRNSNPALLMLMMAARWFARRCRCGENRE